MKYSILFTSIQKTKKPKPSTKRPSPPAISIAERILRPEPKPRSWDKPTVKKPPTPKINLSERLQRPKKKPKKSWNKKTPPSKIGLDPSKPKTSARKKGKYSNPLVTNGISHSNHLNEYNTVLGALGTFFSFLFNFSMKFEYQTE